MNANLRPPILSLAAVIAFASIAIAAEKSDNTESKDQPRSPQQRPSNRLISEKSPYLLQHAHNPVDWYPWGEEAFAKARRENKPIFLSIGYSTCHWCHVMERESFENPETAAIMNKHFVNIKVDREERPDIDRVYMTFVQAATGSGGWPMSVWLTPDLKPFVGGTYFPPESQAGRPGFPTVLKQIAGAWQNDREKIVAAGDAILQELRNATQLDETSSGELTQSLFDSAFETMKSSFDPRHGGFGSSPKFPHPVSLNFLLRHHYHTGEKQALEMTLVTLRKMAEGGIRDHLGGGFHRYSVDQRWHVPHFEKMLYDQAQLACAYLEAFQITKKQFFATVAEEILEYVRRDMTGPLGQFFSAEDADSPLPDDPNRHGEGAFYVWSSSELTKLLGPENAAIFNHVYGVTDGGNVDEDPHNEFRNQNILFVSQSVEAAADKFGKTPEQISDILADARKRLFQSRNKRPRPLLDDKSITAWNGLMISAFARAHQVLRKPSHLTTAHAAAQFVKQHLYDSTAGTLSRRYRTGVSGIPAYADDYAFLIQALIDLYEAGFDPAHLKWAMELQSKQDELFWDPEHGGYFATPGTDPTILLRIKEDNDGAEPSPNSVAALNLLRLAELTDSKQYREKAAKIFSAFSSQLAEAPTSMPQLLSALYFDRRPRKQIVVAGKLGAPDTEKMLKAIQTEFIPNKIVILAHGNHKQQELAQVASFTKELKVIDGKATAYVCENYVCQLPTTDVAKLRELIGQQKETDTP